MLTGIQPTSSKFRRYRAVGLSVAAHLGLLAFIALYVPKVIEVAPAWLAHGDGAHTYKLIYLPPGSEDVASPEVAKLRFPSPVIRPRPVPKKATPEQAPQQSVDADPGDRNTQPGSPLGTFVDGPITGHEVHVAYPVVYPDPPVDRSDFRDLQGDVIVEVTIDSQGNVVETKLVQAIGHGIDEKIVATLRQWRYQPATLDGTPVASRHDVHFHFPS